MQEACNRTLGGSTKSCAARGLKEPISEGLNTADLSQNGSTTIKVHWTKA